MYCKNQPLEVVIVTESEQNAFDHIHKILMHLPFNLRLGAGHGCHPIWYHTIVVSQQLSHIIQFSATGNLVASGPVIIHFTVY